MLDAPGESLRATSVNAVQTAYRSMFQVKEPRNRGRRQEKEEYSPRARHGGGANC